MSARIILVFLAALTALSGCSDKPNLMIRSKTDLFVVDYNPPYIDVLWVVDDRSPMKRAAEHLTAEATEFFKRLDASASQYRMAFTTADMTYNKGTLRSTAIITKNVGDLKSRSSAFSTIFHNIINLKTGGLSQGVSAAVTALRQYFKPQANVPLVIVFISDAYDASEVPDGVEGTKEDYFKNEFTALMGGRSDLLKVYSINYVSGGERCATRYHADIDQDPQKAGNLYDKLTEYFPGDIADLCGSFSSQVDLTGLRLKELPHRFRLTNRPDQKPQVSISKDGSTIETPPWSYDPTTNEIFFATVPPEGSTIQVVY